MEEVIRTEATRLIEELHKMSLIPPNWICNVNEINVKPDGDRCCYVTVTRLRNDLPNITVYYDDILRDEQPAFYVGFGAYNDQALENLVESCSAEFPNRCTFNSYEQLQKTFQIAEQEVVGQPAVDCYDPYRGFGIYGGRGNDTLDLLQALDFVVRVLCCLPEYRVAEDADARQTSILVIADHAEQTAHYANGQTIVRTVTIKNKELRMPRRELPEYIEQLLESQDNKCALTGITFQFHGAHIDYNLLPSLDRKDSAGHYQKGNLQVVCQFINFWKNATPNDEFKRLLRLVTDAATT